VLAAAVGDTLAGGIAAKRRVRTAATAALAPPAAKPEQQAPGAVPEAIAAASVDPAPVADPDAASPGTDRSDAATVCTNLCSLQMVELCNNDRSLWSQHGSRWEDTRCGVRREEPFLTDCYRMQWLSGTYERACVQPCEDSPESRLRLVTMLRRSGCIRSAG
jgi:hypothetical protein